MRADFQNCHIWAWNLVIGKSSRSCTYTIFLSQVYFCSMSSGFRGTCMDRFPNLLYLGMKLGHWQKFTKRLKFKVNIVTNGKMKNCLYFKKSETVWMPKVFKLLNFFPMVLPTWHNSAPLRDISLWNLSGLGIDLSRSLRSNVIAIRAFRLMLIVIYDLTLLFHQV